MLKVKTFHFIFFFLHYKGNLPHLVWACHGDITCIQGKEGGRLKGQKEVMKREREEGRKPLRDFLALLDLNLLYYSLFVEHWASLFCPREGKSNPLNSQALNLSRQEKLASFQNFLGECADFGNAAIPMLLKAQTSLSLLFQLRAPWNLSFELGLGQSHSICFVRVTWSQCLNNMF